MIILFIFIKVVRKFVNVFCEKSYLNWTRSAIFIRFFEFLYNFNFFIAIQCHYFFSNYLTWGFYHVQLLIPMKYYFFINLLGYKTFSLKYPIPWKIFSSPLSLQIDILAGFCLSMLSPLYYLSISLELQFMQGIFLSMSEMLILYLSKLSLLMSFKLMGEYFSKGSTLHLFNSKRHECKFQSLEISWMSVLI